MEPSDLAIWSHLPPLPLGLGLVRRDTVELPRPGRTGSATVFLADLVGPTQVHLALLYHPDLLARDVRAARDFLLRSSDLFTARFRELGTPTAGVVLGLLTEVATPSVLSACVEQGLAVFDRTGTVVVRSPPLLVHVEGRRRVPRRPRVSFFSGKSLRIVRILLAQPFESITAQAAAARAQISYVYAHNVLTGLEREGFVNRLSPKSGFLLRNPVQLLRAWIEQASSRPLDLIPFYAPATTPESLKRVDEARRAAGLNGIFTLASGLAPAEVHASGLPHGLYLSGEPDGIAADLRWRRTTPHNLLVLRADPAEETSAGGIYYASRELIHGRGVSLPQLAVDIARAGGRGGEQSEFLIQRYA